MAGLIQRVNFFQTKLGTYLTIMFLIKKDVYIKMMSLEKILKVQLYALFPQTLKQEDLSSKYYIKLLKDNLMIGEKEPSNKKLKTRAKKISFALRNTFINEVFEKGSNIRKAARKFKINYSTAKVIISNLKKGNISKRRRTRRCCVYGKMRRVAESEQYEKMRCTYKEIRKKQRQRILRDRIQIICTVGYYAKESEQGI